jgi:hypothetical protein
MKRNPIFILPKALYWDMVAGHEGLMNMGIHAYGKYAHAWAVVA